MAACKTVGMHHSVILGLLSGSIWMACDYLGFFITGELLRDFEQGINYKQLTKFNVVRYMSGCNQEVHAQLLWPLGFPAFRYLPYPSTEFVGGGDRMRSSFQLHLHAVSAELTRFYLVFTTRYCIRTLSVSKCSHTTCQNFLSAADTVPSSVPLGGLNPSCRYQHRSGVSRIRCNCS